MLILIDIRAKGSAESVSMRDVSRCCTLIAWFAKHQASTPGSSHSNMLRPIILALGHCYHSRLGTNHLREEYRNIQHERKSDEEIKGREVL